MTARTRISHSERKRLNRDAVLSATTRLLEAGHSYTELSVEQLLGEAGVSRATFYANFRNKGDLLSALAEEVIDSMLARAAGWWTTSGRPAEAAVLQSVRDIAAAYLDRQAVMAAVAEVATYDPAVRDQLRGLVDRSTDALARHISDGQRAGVVDKRLDPDRAAHWIVWMCERGLYQLVRTAEGAERDRQIEALSRLIWNSLYPERP